MRCHPSADLTQVEVRTYVAGWVAALHVDVDAGVDPDDDLAWFAPSELAHVTQLES